MKGLLIYQAGSIDKSSSYSEFHRIQGYLQTIGIETLKYDYGCPKPELVLIPDYDEKNAEIIELSNNLKSATEKIEEDKILIEKQESDIEYLNSMVEELNNFIRESVKLPYERKRLLWGDLNKETLLCPDCLTDIMGGIGDETFVVQCPKCGCFVDSTMEPIAFNEETELRLKTLQAGETNI